MVATAAGQPGTGGADGNARREALSQRRAAAVDAFIDLLLADGTPPRPEEVAQMAGVSLATLYRYFATLDELRQEAVSRVLVRFSGLFTVADVGTGSRRERISRFVACRLELHETLHPLLLHSRVTAASDAGTSEMVRFGRRFLADQVRDHFDPELRMVTPARRGDIVAAVAVLTSVEGWDQYRHAHDHTPAQIRRAWTDALDRLLPDP